MKSSIVLKLNANPTASGDTDGEDSDVLTVEGHATLFNRDVEKFWEIIRFEKGCFADCLNDDVRFFFNHDGMTLARTKNNSMVLSEDDAGLKVRATLAPTREGHDLYNSIKSGLIDEMSVGFGFGPEGTEFGLYEGENEDWHGMSHYRIHKVEELYDVSAVSIPAMAGTDIKAQLKAEGHLDALKRVSASNSETEPTEDTMTTQSEPVIVPKKAKLPRRRLMKGLFADA